MNTLLADFRVGLRLLSRDKAFAITAGLTLAVCIGANVALFSVIRGVLFKPLAIPDAERVVIAGNVYPGAGVHEPMGSAIPDYFDRLRDVTAFAEQSVFKRNDRSVDQGNTPVSVKAMTVTPSFFRVAGVDPQLGRTFIDQKGAAGDEFEVVISDSFWRNHFGGEASVVGRSLRLDGRPYIVTGVMPRGFNPTDDSIELWTPMTFTPKEKSDDSRHSNTVAYFARLRSGSSVQQAQAQIDSLNAANLDRFPAFREVLVNAGFHTVVSRLQDQMVKDVRGTLYLMWGGSLFVLLIGCVNVANLALVRSRVRLRELATRLALGAGTGRIARQLAVEHLVLACGAAAVGIAIGAIALQSMSALSLQELPRAQEIRLDGVVVLSTAAAAIVIGLVLGLIPVVATMSANVLGVLREEGRTATTGRGAQSLRRGLVVTQVACAFLLLIGAGLLFASFRKVLAVDPGFATSGVLTGAVSLPGARYSDADAIRRFTTDAVRRLRVLPNVKAAGATDSLPLGNSANASAILAEGYRSRPGESLLAPAAVRVSDGYFEAIGATLVDGRFFTERDTAGATHAIIVDDRLARRFWPDRSPIGRRMYSPSDDADPAVITDKTEFFTVVGVVKEMKLRNLTDGDNNLVGAYFFPLAQDPQSGLTFVLRTDGDPGTLSGSLRREVAAIDPQLPVFEMQPMSYWTDRSLANRRSPALLSMAFGFVALFLSAIGIYGVLAYLVTQRRKEIGIRVALGSSAAGVFRLVLREGLVLVAVGLIVGGIGSFLLRRTLETQLFGVTASNPMVLLLVSVVLAAVALVACAVPARRATRINPLIVLTE